MQMTNYVHVGHSTDTSAFQKDKLHALLWRPNKVKRDRMSPLV